MVTGLAVSGTLGITSYLQLDALRHSPDLAPDLGTAPVATLPTTIATVVVPAAPPVDIVVLAPAAAAPTPAPRTDPPQTVPLPTVPPRTDPPRTVPPATHATSQGSPR